MSEVTVVGGGPAGSFAALNLAKLGIGVTVFEEHPICGAPSHCAGHLSILSLTKLGLYPLPDGIVENTFSRAHFFSPAGMKFSVSLKKPVTCVVNREAFDRYLSQIAEKAGAAYQLNSRVESLFIENGAVKGVRVAGDKGKAFPAKIVIDAEGISSRILKQSGLAPIGGYKLVYGVETEVENIKDVETDAVEVFLGENYAPGFYAWIIPRTDETAKVGLATRAGDPREFLQRFLRKHPIASRQLSKARVLQTTFHPISLGGPIPKAYSRGFLVVGDAASHVKPTTGGGVVLGLTCASIAAQVAREALANHDLSAKQLKAYQTRCEEVLGFDNKVMLNARNMFDSLPDRRIDQVISFCSHIGLGKYLEDVDDIDFQGQTLIKVLRKPIVYPVLAYFLSSYLFANI
jgi:digeranylgeranylglycerophospholipid reductase